MPVAFKTPRRGIGLAIIFALFMLVHRDLSALPSFRNAVITIGTFDGVHAGHRKIIEQLKKEAAAINGETVIITFYPHPRKIVREGQSPVAILTTLSEKSTLLYELGINHLVVIPFDESFASQPAETYIEHFLFGKFHPHTVIIGYDHKFGNGRQGDYHLLEAYGKKLGFAVKEIPEQILHEVIISSTKIRQALLQNDVATANEFLSYDYFFEGLIVKGNQLGRTIGYPTANVVITDDEKLVPGNGVYAVNVSFETPAASREHYGLPGDELLDINKKSSKQENYTSEFTSDISHLTSGIFKGMMNIGLRPTVNGSKRTIEVNIFDFNEDIYGAAIRVFIKYFLRPEVKFNGLGALKEQLAKDKELAVRYLSINA